MGGYFETGEPVRLVEPHERLHEGRVGRVIGRYDRDPVVYVVDFGDGEVASVPEDRLASADGDAGNRAA